MARYLGPKAKLSRREGTDLFLKSARRAISDKAKFESKPGQHGRTSGSRTSDFGLQLREKQKARRLYGVLERQFRRHFEAAERLPGLTGENLLQVLEMRLDNVVYRMGYADSRAQARQIVRHGHIDVNGHKLDIPSYACKPGDQISLRQSSRETGYVQMLQPEMRRKTIAAWMEVNPNALSGRIARVPARDELDLNLNEQLIVEFYSR